MGMTQKLCPRCKKKRRKAERSNTKPGKHWEYLGEDIGLVCYVCVKEIHEEEAAVYRRPSANPLTDEEKAEYLRMLNDPDTDRYD